MWIRNSHFTIFIHRFQHQQLEIETKLKPFLPDFIPAVGDPDAFLKVDRPDAIEEKLGLYVLGKMSYKSKSIKIAVHNIFMCPVGVSI